MDEKTEADKFSDKLWQFAEHMLPAKSYAYLWMHTKNDRLGKVRPADACVDEESFERCKKVLKWDFRMES